MIFKKVVIENFLTISQATVELDNRGLVLIQGRNDDDPSAASNGAGKSSLADAVCWCLYGTTARGVSGDAVVNNEAKKNCAVHLRIEDGPDIYVITRYRKEKHFKNQLRIDKIVGGSTITDLTKGTDKLTQEVVNQIIGASHDVFRAAVYAGQEQMPDLPGMSDKQLKMLVEEAAGVDILEAAYERARASLNESKRHQDEVLHLKDKALTGLSFISRQITDLTTSMGVWHAERIGEIERLTKEARAAGVNAKKLAEHIQTHFDKKALEALVEELQWKLKSVSGEREIDRIHEKALQEAQLDTAKWYHELKRCEMDVIALIKSLDHIDTEVGCPCPTCARPYTTADIEPAKARIRADLEDAKKRKRDTGFSLDVALEAQKRATETRDAHRAAMTDVSATASQLTSVNEELVRLGKLERERDKFVEEVRQHIKAISDLKLKANPYDGDLARARRREADAVDHLDSVQESLEEATAKVEVDELVMGVFGPAGVRAHILDTVTPFLNDQTAKYLGALSDGAIQATWSTLTKTAAGELREKFAIEVVNDRGGASFAALSGGEKRKVRIACALALQDLVASRATKAIPLFIGDEIDDALDAAGLERLTGILEEKARERGSVFVISHNDLKDWIRESITVVKKARGKSTIEAV